jgi:hypothetical protein
MFEKENRDLPAGEKFSLCGEDTCLAGGAPGLSLCPLTYGRQSGTDGQQSSTDGRQESRMETPERRSNRALSKRGATDIVKSAIRVAGGTRMQEHGIPATGGSKTAQGLCPAREGGFCGRRSPPAGCGVLLVSDCKNTKYNFFGNFCRIVG